LKTVGLTTAGLTFITLFQSINAIITHPTNRNTNDNNPTAIYDEDMYLFEASSSFAAMLFTRQFLKPLPIPKSNIFIQMKTEATVSQAP
jgi:hypothetical protein